MGYIGRTAHPQALGLWQSLLRSGQKLPDPFRKDLEVSVSFFPISIQSLLLNGFL